MKFDWLITAFNYEEILRKRGIVDIRFSDEIKYIHKERLNRELEINI